jgi:hypothetical protein
MNQHTEDDRAHALRCIASNWDALCDTLTAGPHVLRPEEATDALITLVQRWAHPSLPSETVHEWMTELRNSVNDLTAYECQGYLPLNLEDRFPVHHDSEVVMGLINSDIDGALFPLLRGVTSADACTECRRVMGNVADWRVATDLRRCTVHSLTNAAVA